MNRTRTASIPLVLGLSLLLGGCGFLPQVQLPQSNATPTPVVVSAEQAATAYSGTICTFNAGARAFADTWKDDAASLRDLKEAASLAKIEAETALSELEGTGWPADIATDVEVVGGYLRTRIERLDQVIGAEAIEELDDIELATTPDEVNDSAARVEEALALGVDFCPQPDPEVPAEPADAELAATTWTGTDSDGDETVLFFGTGGVAEVTVADVVYEGTWELADGMLTIDVSTTENSLAFNGLYESGATALALSGTATNGHTWTLDVERL
jgi:hypothetical protein